MHTSLPRKPLREMTFRICSTFNATGPALEANAQLRERSLAVAGRALVDKGLRGRRTDQPGMQNL